MFSLRTVYIVLFLFIYFSVIFWWYFLPEINSEKIGDRQVEVKKTISEPILDQITLRQLNVVLENKYFVKDVRYEKYPDEYGAIIPRGLIGLPTLIYVLKNTIDQDLQITIINIMSHLDDQSSRIVLEDLLKTNNHFDRLFLINSIARLGNKDSIPLFKKMIANKLVGEDEYICLAKALLRLDDKEGARVAFEAYVKSGKKDYLREAIEAIQELNSKESIPVLIHVLKNMKIEDGYFFQLKKTLCMLGDMPVIGEMIALGLHDEKHKADAIDVLCRSKSICDVFGLDYDYGLSNGICLNNIYIQDEDLFLKAVDEWYCENILKKQSPYRVADTFAFSNPFAEEKLSAWKFLKQEFKNSGGNNSTLRVIPIDIKITEIDTEKEFAFINGSSHGGELDIYVCRFDLDVVSTVNFTNVNTRSFFKRI